MKKLFALVLSVILVVALVGCGGSSAKTKGEAKMKGTTETWGEISVFVPDGFEFHGGNITGVDDTDEKQCYMKKDPQSMYDYIWIVVKDDEASAKSNVETTKDVNKAEDVTVKADNGEWTGCHYVYESYKGSVDCGAIYATVDGKTIQVNFAGYAPESKEMKAVLSSLK